MAILAKKKPAPKPAPKGTAVKLDLHDVYGEFQNGKLVAISGVLHVAPYSVLQHKPWIDFLKSGNVQCYLFANPHDALGVTFTMLAPSPHPVNDALLPPPVVSAAPVVEDKAEVAKASAQYEEAVQFVQSHGVQRDDAESTVAEYTVPYVIAHKKMKEFEQELTIGLKDKVLNLFRRLKWR